MARRILAVLAVGVAYVGLLNLVALAAHVHPWAAVGVLAAGACVPLAAVAFRNTPQEKE